MQAVKSRTSLSLPSRAPELFKARNALAVVQAAERAGVGDAGRGRRRTCAA